MKYAMKYAIASAIVAGVCHSAVSAQTMLNLDSFDWLRQNDLESGEFDGQFFTLGPDLSIEVNDGGRVDDVGDLYHVTPFSFAGSTVNVNDGGWFGSRETLIADVELNIFEGGIAEGLSVFDGVTVNVLGGELQLPLDISGASSVVMSSGRIFGYSQGLTGGPVTVIGGVIGSHFTVESGGVLSVSGGQIGEQFKALTGSDVTFSGGEFQMNGSGVTDLNGGLPTDAVFTGTLPDGSVFILGEQARDDIAPGVMTLVANPLAPADVTPQVVSSGTVSAGLRSGQTLTLVDGGQLGNHFAAVGATLNIEGGTVGENLETAYSTVNISGGHIGDNSEVIGDYISLFDGSVANITGGRFSDKLHTLAGSKVDVSGGVFEDGMLVRRDSDTTLHGGDFQLNGQPISELDAGLPENGIFTGTLADGTVFIFSNGSQIEANATTLASASLGPIDTTPQIISTGIGPQGLRSGQALTLSGDGALGDNFVAVGSTLNIEGGTVGDRARIAYSHVEISGGRIEGAMSVYDGGTVNVTGAYIKRLETHAGSLATVSGGSIEVISAFSDSEVQIDGGSFDLVSIHDDSIAVIDGGLFGVDSFSRVSVYGGMMTINGGAFGSNLRVHGGVLNINGGVIGDRLSTSFNGLINMSGGTVGDDFHAGNLSKVNITGGSIGSGFRADYGSTVNITGGGFGPVFTAQMQSEINLFVLELLLDGTPVDLDLNVPFTIAQRDGALLTAILADGSSFELALNQNNLLGQDWIDTNATLTATLVPEPASLAMLVGGALIVHRRRG
jgi:hypothetical protein